MKRILSACMEQTQRFESEMDLAAYLKKLERKRTAYKVVSQQVQPDGSVVVEIKKAYNNYSVGDYFG